MFQTFLHQVNFLAVLVAAFVYFAVGAIWYTALGKIWMKFIDRTEEQLRNGSKLVFLYTLLAELVIVFVMAFVVWILGTGTYMSAIKVSLFFSLGLVCTVMAINNWYGQRSWKLTMIDSGYHVIGLMIATIILTFWK